MNRVLFAMVAALITSVAYAQNAVTIDPLDLTDEELQDCRRAQANRDGSLDCKTFVDWQISSRLEKKILRQAEHGSEAIEIEALDLAEDADIKPWPAFQTVAAGRVPSPTPTPAP